MFTHYQNGLYDELYQGWHRYEYQSFKGSHKLADESKPKTVEILYCNFKPVRQRSLFNMGEFARYKESKTSGEDHLFYGGEISHQAGVKFSNHFIKLFQKIGIPGISFHCLRHTNATRLTEVIQDVSVTSKYLVMQI